MVWMRAHVSAFSSGLGSGGKRPYSRALVARAWAEVGVGGKQEGGSGSRCWCRLGCRRGGWALPVLGTQGRSSFGEERTSYFWSCVDFGGLWVSKGMLSAWTGALGLGPPFVEGPSGWGIHWAEAPAAERAEGQGEQEAACKGEQDRQAWR